MLERFEYVNLMRDLLSGDPQKVRDANRRLYVETCSDHDETGAPIKAPSNREADLVLAEVAG
jgi:hypothetical protein